MQNQCNSFLNKPAFIFSLDFGHWYAKLSYAGMYLKIDAGWEFQLEFKDQHGQIYQKVL
ncbi:hypothetical protein [Acinetobacter sp. CFCC 11171]|uniref:hypothetical protein n=1 Tax=Acinetobacter sp. CFCC 11171 TaxID=1775558 RepID=UPI0013A6931C|nr:hypothetical protein [Acinetobacter sp. CFCC 11171]